MFLNLKVGRRVLSLIIQSDSEIGRQTSGRGVPYDQTGKRVPSNMGPKIKKKSFV